jgi:hypothetical protein
LTTNSTIISTNHHQSADISPYRSPNLLTTTLVKNGTNGRPSSSLYLPNKRRKSQRYDYKLYL